MTIINDSAEIMSYIQASESLITGQKALCREGSGGPPLIKGCGGTVANEDFLYDLTDEPCVTPHIDIVSTDFTLAYEIADTPKPVDRFVLIGFGGGGHEYAMREFDLYGSEDGDTFAEKNLLCQYRCAIPFRPGARDTSDVMFVFDQPIRLKTIGFKIFKENPTDDCMRMAFVGVYSDEYEKTCHFLQKRYEENLLKAEDIALPAEQAEILTDHRVFDTAFVSCNDTEFTVSLPDNIISGVLYAAYSGSGAILFADGKPVKSEEVYEDCFLAELPLNWCGKITLRMAGEAKLYELGVCKTTREITVSGDVLVDDFYGIGACALPMALMDRSVEQGYNKALWQEERRRTNLCRPSVIRLWFQPDWFITSREAYYRHEYDFDSPRMQAVYAYLDSYRDAGIEVEMNYGWKVDPENQEWFSIPGVRALRESAPADLDEFAFSCAEFMSELIEKRGYTNVKYLTFYNEPCSRDVYSPCWVGDFLVTPSAERREPKGEIAWEKYNYWKEMAVKTKAALRKKGLLGKVKLWGAECAGSDTTMALWKKEFEKDEEPVLDVYTVHRYHHMPHEIDCLGELLKSTGNMPFVATEFATSSLGKDWEHSNPEMVLSFIKNGFAGAFLWIFSGITMTSPANFSIDSDNENMWHSLHINCERVNQIFYEMCLFMRYIPVHSKSLLVKTPEPKTKRSFYQETVRWIETDDTDIRAAAFLTPKGDYVVIAETRQCESERELVVRLPETEALTFYKFSVGYRSDLEEPPHIPYCEKIVKSENGLLCDSLKQEYALTFYTTEKPYEQLICDNGVVELSVGETYEITYTLHDTDCSSVSFCVAEGEELIELDGAKVTAKATGTAAVKVTLEDCKQNCYDIVLIKIQ